MRKRAESGLAVMGSHATGPDASEGQAWNPSLEDDIVKTDGSRARGAQQALLLALITSEQVNGERFVLTLHAGDGMVEIRNFNHRQKRTEEFIGHQRVGVVIDADQRWSNPAAGFIAFPSK